MKRVLSGLDWKICLVYLDDIIVFSKTFKEHLENLNQVLDCLKRANLKLSNISKISDISSMIWTQAEKTSYLPHIFRDRPVSSWLYLCRVCGGVICTNHLIEFIIDCDASNDGMGGVLSQVQIGTEKVICYFSKAFTKPERRYCVTRRELLAVVASIRHFHHYLYGRHFLV
jgi:hypothetical protein